MGPLSLHLKVGAGLLRPYTSPILPGIHVCHPRHPRHTCLSSPFSPAYMSVHPRLLLADRHAVAMSGGTCPPTRLSL